MTKGTAMNTEKSTEAVDQVTAFFGRVMLSKRNVARLLGISPSALIRWMEGTTQPYEWTAEQALRRIEWFDEADRESGLYARLDTLTPRERMAELEKVIDAKINAA